MDNYGLLTLLQGLQQEIQGVVAKRKLEGRKWRLQPGVVVFPETRCCFCNIVLRSNGIWIFSGAPQYRHLVGMIMVQRNGRVSLRYPGHPHLMHSETSGTLCLGNALTGMDLLASPVNIRDCPRGLDFARAWYRRTWNHDCPQAARRINEIYNRDRALSGLPPLPFVEETSTTPPSEELTSLDEGGI